jgi:hypothetical protein
MMNDKLIAEFAHKANMTVFPSGLKEFAELIIQECVGICMIEYDTGLEPAPQAPWIAKQIKDHFGVE